MRRFRLFATVLIGAAFLAGPAHADPVTDAVVAVATWLGASAATASAVASAVLGTLISSAISIGAQFLAGKPKKAVGGSNGQLQTGGTLPRSFIIGRGLTGGKLCYHNTWGTSGKTPNAHWTFVIALQDVPAGGLAEIWNGSTKLTYDTGATPADQGYPVPECFYNGADFMWARFYDGTQTTADSWLVSQFGSDPDRPYDSGRIGKGVAYVIVTVRYNTKLFPSPPQWKFAVDGTKFYDPRKDSTAGGSGSHRWANQSTWELSSNPKVVEYNILRGMSYNGTWFYGLQNMAAGRLPLDAWFAAMNACDMGVSKSGGGTEPQFRISGEVTIDTQPADLIDEINKCTGGARTTEAGGIYKPYVGAAGTAVLSITDDDIIISEEQTENQFSSIDDTVNGATGSCPDPTNAWAMKDLPPFYNADLETEDDGRRLTSDFQFNLCPYPEQGQRMLKSAVSVARRYRKHVIVLPPWAWGVEGIDFVSYTSARAGYESKLFSIDSGTDNADLDQGIGITEVDPSDYDWHPDSDYTTPSNGPLVTSRPPAQELAGFSVEAVTTSGDDGRAVAAIRLHWDADQDDINGVQYRVRLTDTGDIVVSGQTDHWQDGEGDISEGILSGTAYQVQAQYRSASDRDFTWSDWLDVTTQDIRISAIDIYDNAISLSHLDAGLQSDIANVATNTAAIEADATRLLATTAGLTSLQDDVSKGHAALLNIQLLIPQLMQTFQRQIYAYVQGVTGGDVLDYAARISSTENAIVDLTAGKADASDLVALDAQINAPSTGLEALISSLSETVALLDPESATATIVETATAARTVGLDTDALASAVLGALAGLHNLQSGQSATLAYYRNEITTQVTQGLSASADAIGQVGAILASSIGVISASVTTESLARVSGDGANAANITTILAALSGLTGSGAVSAAITSEASARAAADNANAFDTALVGAAVGNVNASGYFGVSAAAAPGDASARVALQVSATAGGTPTTAAMFLDALSDGTSRVIFDVDQFFITDGTNKGSPFLFGFGELFIKQAVIPTITSDKLDVGIINAGTLIADNVIVTGHLQANTATNPQFAAGGSASGISTTLTTVQSVPITLSGAPCVINVSFDAQTVSGAGSATWKILRGSTVIRTASTGALNAGTSSWTTVAATHGEAPAAGAYTYTLQVAKDSGWPNVNVSNAFLSVVEYKK